MVLTAARRRGSDASFVGFENEACFEVDPLSPRGRTVQTVGMVVLPLLPSIALFIYCSIALAGNVQQHTALSRLHGSLLAGDRVLPLLVALQSELDGVLVFLATNGSELMGTLPEFRQKTDFEIGILAADWPGDIHPRMNTRDEFRIHLANHRGKQDRFSVTAASAEIAFYRDIVLAIADWVMEPLLSLSSQPGPLAVRLTALTSLVHGSVAMGMEQGLGTVYFLSGQLGLNEYRAYVEAMTQAQTALQMALDLDEEVRELYTDQFLAFSAYDAFNQYRDSISHNVPAAPRLYEGVVWDRKYTYFSTVVHGLVELLEHALIDTQLENKRAVVNHVVYLVILMVLLLLIVVPFNAFTAKWTTESLFMYAFTTEIKNLELRKQKRRSEKILNQMLPLQIAQRLRRGEAVPPEEYASATVFFSDIADFAEISSESSPMDIVTFLNELYYFMDTQIEKYDVYKVETISCVYMVTSGIPNRNGARHAIEICRMALDLLALTDDFHISHLPGRRKLQLRIGAHTGPVVAGVVGNKMPRYCLFGDTVNFAARMQTNGEPRRVHISRSLVDTLGEVGGFEVERRGEVSLKGKGTVEAWWLLGRRDTSAVDATQIAAPPPAGWQQDQQVISDAEEETLAQPDG